ncbi:hypothetical protein [Enterobacter asburiae]|uniref:hypothetical protein n=1 Tax=Enterobacter asburiae TaxID=61645 RepID=UPI00157612E1|nr:hypothetical protein [Enterobacter asburiae]NQF31019.1 hypothetical protein [Enterobacter asburiae]
MSIFAVVATNPGERSRPKIKQLIHEKIPGTHFLEVDDCLWFVDTELATSKELTILLCGEDNPDKVGSFVVLPVTAYYGMHNKTVWEWLSSKGL